MPDVFTVQANIARFRDLLATELDTEKRRTIEKLLAEYEARLQQLVNRRTASDRPCRDG
jgi:hypothetical protein